MGSVMFGSEQAITGQSGFMRPVVVSGSPVWTLPPRHSHMPRQIALINHR
jgi:hypothetical protein